MSSAGLFSLGYFMMAAASYGDSGLMSTAFLILASLAAWFHPLEKKK